MNYNEFKFQVCEDIRNYLPEKFKDADILLKQVVKNNGRMLDGLLVINGDTNMAWRYIGISRQDEATIAIENPRSSFQKTNAQKYFY